MKFCALCNKELLVYYNDEGEECCDECFINSIDEETPDEFV